MKPLKPILSSRIYFPGLISLVCIPLFCIGFLFAKGKLTQLYQMRVSYYNKLLIDELSKNRHKPPIYPDTFRHYKKIVLLGDTKQNELHLKDIETQFKKMIANKDSMNGVQIQFSTHTKYTDVIKTIDMFEQDRYNYIIYNGNIYVFWVKPLATRRVTRSTSDMGLIFDDLLTHSPTEKSFIEKLDIEFKEDAVFLKPFWPCLIPLAGMIYFWRKSKIVPVS